MRVGNGVLRWMCSRAGLSYNDEPILAYVAKCSTFVERMAKAGKLRAYKSTHGIFRVKRADIDRFLEGGAAAS